MSDAQAQELAEWHELLSTFKAIPQANRAAALELIKAISKLGPNSTEILRSQAAGLVRGLPYGDWNEGRDMVAEAIAEARDGANYTRKEWLRLEKVIEAHSLFTKAHAALIEAEKSSAI